MISRWTYIRASLFAAAGALVALFAGSALVGVWIPLINPGHYRVCMHGSPRSALFYTVGTAICLALITLGKIGSDRNLKVVKAYQEQKKEKDGPIGIGTPLAERPSHTTKSYGSRN